MIEIIYLLINLYHLNFLEYYIHKLSHNYKYGGLLYKYHHIHHSIDYPPNRLMVEKYHNLISDNSLIYLIIFGTGCIFYYFIMPYYYYKIFIFETIVYFFIMDYMHN